MRYPCRACGRAGAELGRFSDGRPSGACADCMDAHRAAIAAWLGRRAVERGELPF